MKERAYELPFTIAIKNTNAILVKKEANDWNILQIVQINTVS